MFNQQPLPLDDEGFSFVETLIRNNMGKPNFAYSVYINKKNIPIIDRATDVEDFLSFIENLHPFTQVIDITFKTNSSNAGKRLTLASPMLNGFDFEITQPLRNNAYTVSQSDKREKEIAERAELRAQSSFMEKELQRREEEINRLQKDVREKEKHIASLKHFSDELEKMLIGMKEDAKKDNNNILFKYAMQIEQAVPGLIGSVLGVKKPDAGILEGTPEEKSGLVGEFIELLKNFTKEEVSSLLRLISRLRENKEILPDMIQIVEEFQKRKFDYLSSVAAENAQGRTDLPPVPKYANQNAQQTEKPVNTTQSTVVLKQKQSSVSTPQPQQAAAQNTQTTAAIKPAQPEQTPVQQSQLYEPVAPKTTPQQVENANNQPVNGTPVQPQANPEISDNADDSALFNEHGWGKIY